MRPGDPVALPIEHGADLLLGEVVGGYEFQGRELLPHRRPARWNRVVSRSSARPPARLQDPRALFRVLVDPDVVRPD
jgi:predicted Mrr-cat superfamily restriction endonuclease